MRRDEARLAAWSEFDLRAGIWTIPADRTKTAALHRVPLSAQAQRIVAGQRVRAEALDSPYVFPTKTGRPIARSVLHQEAKRVMSATVHGWRAAFRTWCADHAADRELCETCLGHVVGSAVERSYQRSDRLELRRPIMQEWADFVLPDG